MSPEWGVALHGVCLLCLPPWILMLSVFLHLISLPMSVSDGMVDARGKLGAARARAMSSSFRQGRLVHKPSCSLEINRSANTFRPKMYVIMHSGNALFFQISCSFTALEVKKSRPCSICGVYSFLSESSCACGKSCCPEITEFSDQTTCFSFGN